MDIVNCQSSKPVVDMDYNVHLGFPKNVFTAALNICKLPLRGEPGYHSFENHGTAPWFLSYRMEDGKDNEAILPGGRSCTFQFTGVAWRFLGYELYHS